MRREENQALIRTFYTDKNLKPTKNNSFFTKRKSGGWKKKLKKVET
jgi:hypothetical protein